jgi:hypothetical protein
MIYMYGSERRTDVKLLIDGHTFSTISELRVARIEDREAVFRACLLPARQTSQIWEP